jgi:hypothetical protein
MQISAYLNKPERRKCLIQLVRVVQYLINNKKYLFILGNDPSRIAHIYFGMKEELKIFNRFNKQLLKLDDVNILNNETLV